MTTLAHWLAQLTHRFEDPLDRTQAQGLWLLFIGSFIGATLITASYIPLFGLTPATLMLASGSIALWMLSVIGMNLLYRGRAQTAVTLFITGILIVVGTLAISYGYPTAYILLPALMVPIVFSGLLRSAVVSTVITIASGAIALLAAIFQPMLAPITAIVVPPGDLTSLAIGLFVAAIGITWVAFQVLGRTLHQALSQARQDRAQAEQALYEARARADTQHQLNAELERARATLQDLVTSLETTAIIVADGVMLAPIVGPVDSNRAQRLNARLLDDATMHRARLVILDITGVPLIDTTAAKALLDIAQGLRLLGCQVAVSGITPTVAMTLTRQGVDLAGMPTTRSPQDALASHFERTFTH